MEIFPSTLIISSDNHLIDNQINQICNQLDNYIKPNNPDIFILNQDTGWTIELTRLIKKFLCQKPFNHQNKVVIIYDAHQLNIESQNALLKSLEEPGNNNYFILATNKPSNITKTIISRCQIIKLKNNHQADNNSKPLIFSSNTSKNLLQSENLSKDKTQVLPYLKNQLKIYQKILIQNPSQENSLIVQKIIKSIQMIESNVDPRSALDFLFLS